MDFTPKQLHYYKRELITLQLEKEIAYLISCPDISSLLEAQPPVTTKEDDFPFLRYIFHNIIIEFPLLKHTCDDNFWPKCKVFLNEFNKVQLDTFYAPKETETSLQRKLIQHKIQKSLVFAFCACIKTIQGQEESIKVLDSTPLQSSTIESTASAAYGQEQQLKINIVTVRQVVDKKRTLFVSQISHTEFLIETWFPHKPTEAIYVARRHGEFKKLRDQLKRTFKNLDIPLVPNKTVVTQHLYRENDRLLLRAWLYQIIKTYPQQIGKSSQLKKFLCQNPIVFTPQEEKDTLVREEADKYRQMEQEKFQKELDKRVFELNEILEVLKKEMIQPGGLIKVFDTIKQTEQIHDLPFSLKKAFEWGRINFAFALHKQFLTSDTAPENLINLRRTHGLMPYRTMSVILRYSNPMYMVKSILDLFLAQPFGGRSLFQRILISNMNVESKALQKEIDKLEHKLDDKMICNKLYNAVRTPLPLKTDFRDNASATLEFLALLNNDAIEPILSPEQVSALTTDHDDHDTNDDTKKIIRHGIKLWKLYAHQYEQELMMNLVFQGVTGDLLKEFISVFYQPLAQVYKAADISTTIRHVQVFLDDLIKVIDSLLTTNEEEEEEDVSNTIQLFIDLVERHEEHFYEFVHNVHSQEASKVFDELIQYVDKLFTFVAHGIPGKIDINYSIEQAGITDTETLEQEVDSICEYRYKQKMYHFERIKRKFQSLSVTKEGLIKMNQDDEIARLDQVFQYIPKSSEMMGALQDFDELVEYDDDIDVERELLSITCSSGDDEFDEFDEEFSGSSSRRSSKSSSGGSHLSHVVGLEKPNLNLIPKIVPYFVDDVVFIMNKK